MASFDPGLHGDIANHRCLIVFLWLFFWLGLLNVSEMRIASNHFTKVFFFRDASSTRKAKLGDELNS